MTDWRDLNRREKRKLVLLLGDKAELFRVRGLFFILDPVEYIDFLSPLKHIKNPICPKGKHSRFNLASATASIPPPLTDSNSSNDLSICPFMQRKHSDGWNTWECHILPQSVFSSQLHGGEEKEKHQTSQMPPRRCRTLISLRSFVQATLARSHYARPESDCQPNSVSQYLPAVIRVDGVINKGKLQERKQPPPRHLKTSALSVCQYEDGCGCSRKKQRWCQLVWNQKSLVCFHLS